MNECHILSLSGGKDSTALAFFIKENYPKIHKKIEYVFYDTGCDLVETYDYLNKLELFLEKPILRLKPEKSFEHLYDVYKFLPSLKFRWCTIELKTDTFKKYMQEKIDKGCKKIHLYVGIRADEPQRIDNYKKQNKENENSILQTHYPLFDNGIIKKDVYNLLIESGVGYPDYYSWRSRSGCYFCFFQRKIEWVGLLERHPDLFQKALDLEKNAGKGYTWCLDMTLEELKKPENIKKIKAKHEEKRKKGKPEDRKLMNVFCDNEL